jgi:hypothetical protein
MGLIGAWGVRSRMRPSRGYRLGLNYRSSARNAADKQRLCYGRTQAAGPAVHFTTGPVLNLRRWEGAGYRAKLRMNYSVQSIFVRMATK